MGCIRREREGYCFHHQCPYPDRTGVECVDVRAGFCELGDRCIDDCEYSFDRLLRDKALKAFGTDYYPEEA